MAYNYIGDVYIIVYFTIKGLIMPEKSNVFIETKLTARASKSLEESVKADLSIEETQESRAHLKELLKENDRNETKIHRD